MSWTASGHLFWAILLITFSAATPKILTSDYSCPCRSSSECPDDSQHLYEGSQVTILPCESEHLIRCCSVISRPIESTRANESLQSDDRKEDIKDDLMEELAEKFGKNQTFNTTTKKSLLNEKFVEKKDIKDDLIEGSIQFVKSDTSNSTSTNLKEHTMTENSPLKRNVITTELKQHVLTQQQEQRSSRQFPEAPTVRYRIFNEVSTNISSSIRFPEEMQEETPEVSLTAQELDLIDRVTSFESTKTSPRKRDASVVEQLKENKENITGKVNLFFPRRINFNKDHRSNVNFKSLSAAKSNVASEKMSNFFKRKTSLETSLTLDRVSSRAINENAKPPSTLARLRNSDTTIRNLLHPEGARNVNRAYRSYAFSKFDNVKKTSV
ncbi:hypothetical protein ANTQUA_LOCUS7314 [Anthophora quadrimaculata]